MFSIKNQQKLNRTFLQFPSPVTVSAGNPHNFPLSYTIATKKNFKIKITLNKHTINLETSGKTA
jgi:hypothetical protein